MYFNLSFQTLELIAESVLKSHDGTENDVAQTVSRLLKYAPDRRGDGGRKEKDKENINNNWRLNSLYSSTLISFIKFFYSNLYLHTDIFVQLTFK